jgi:ATP-binding cassette subfamily B protein
LDSISERAIQAGLVELMKGRTTIVIAHRLSTVQQVDRILVFEEGRIVEEGPHDDLIARPDGRYRRLYDTQAGTFGSEGALSH